MTAARSSSGIGFRFSVVVAGQTFVGETTALQAVETERRFDCGITSLFMGTSGRMEALWWLGWRALYPDVELGPEADAAFDAWLAGLESFDIAEDDALVDAPPPPASPLPERPLDPAALRPNRAARRAVARRG